MVLTACGQGVKVDRTKLRREAEKSGITIVRFPTREAFGEDTRYGSGYVHHVRPEAKDPQKPGAVEVYRPDGRLEYVVPGASGWESDVDRLLPREFFNDSTATLQAREEAWKQATHISDEVFEAALNEAVMAAEAGTDSETDSETGSVAGWEAPDEGRAARRALAMVEPGL